MAILVVQVDQRLTWLAVRHHRRKRATIQTKLATRVIDVTQHPLRASVAQHVLGDKPSDALGTAVPVCDAPVTGDDVHTIGDLIEQVLVELRLHVDLRDQSGLAIPPLN